MMAFVGSFGVAGGGATFAPRAAQRYGSEVCGGDVKAKVGRLHQDSCSRPTGRGVVMSARVRADEPRAKTVRRRGVVARHASKEGASNAVQSDSETDENGMVAVQYYRPEQGGENFSRYQFYPQNALLMAGRNFVSELEAIAGEIGQALRSLVGKRDDGSLPQMLKLTVSNEDVNARERYREDVLKEIPEVWPPVKALYTVLCQLLDVWFDDNAPIQRFWFLETVARVPYFSYVSILHLYETLGWWRDAKLIQLHSLEAANEYMHLLVMESLGGNRKWKDRFFAEHLAIMYYWAIVVLFLISPKQSYAFSQLLEAHATDTYTVFLEQNEARLKALPPPECAVLYYNDPDDAKAQTIERRLFPKFDFADFRQVAKPVDKSIAVESLDYVESLYDVFRNIAKDEQNHVEAMVACQGLSQGRFDGFDPERNTIIVGTLDTKQKRAEKQKFVHSKRAVQNDFETVADAVTDKVSKASSTPKDD
ncbi:Ubiquinol oxidase 4, chloroplastic/chromoplastic [Porphyridium purpureum]|uniref:Ubiquinol oxidase 4, chloroplastic/chromoplastic n=1 Tax=Porphyridium purpureum TaxID=35688 RepID=A0A5J4YJU4_PORPP|nr:Ubiquinol oxidase 4, chloroplastic/chromoplastic [Porphyridium purpureum]|eukprot:POR5598..scf246_12